MGLGNDTALLNKKKSRPKTTERGTRKREKAAFNKKTEILSILPLLSPIALPGVSRDDENYYENVDGKK